ncbi:nucleotide disphospho-sugar-binding domain-containing protein [Kibdelosporangium persicum]|uniref:DNTP-hexose glycosyl transferase n=1 Tax=Kibdelosporangium persicum TaxID=2698649 RepID=A0ABX2EWZ8_9PSEU|nr:nucleotide disphospho-sugar-binding domain-containing protein [Kibdelosporangium persicum]NRN63223.1 DNTP-hexose glycosyl transferase [Kibdelosporangium persicum]
MKFLFVPGNSPSPIFSQAVLATAARSAGHQVMVGGIDWVLPDIASVGLSPVRISPLTEQDVAEFMATAPEDPVEQAIAVGRIYARIALDTQRPLLELAEHWRPDLVVGGSMFYSAPLLAHQLGIPAVRLDWDRCDSAMYAPGAAEVLEPELSRFGLTTMPDPDLWVDICPPSLRAKDAPDVRLMRWSPVNPQIPLEPWMYRKGDRPRVYITAGARLFSGDHLRDMARGIADLGAEVLIGAPERVAKDLREQLPDATIGWMPLDVVAPTCDVILHHGGGVTDMTAIRYGVPQVIVNYDISRDAMQQLADYGAAIMLKPGEQEPEKIAAACREVLGDPRFRARAGELAAEIESLPAPAEVVGLMEKLVTGR